MKRVLLGTTALVAAGVIAAGDAEAKFDATLNGYYYWAYGVVNQDDDGGATPEPGNGLQNQALNSDSEVHFRIKQTFDNGIEVGGRLELEGSSASGDRVDERWIFFRGGFGELRVGEEDDARKLKSYTAPSASGFLFNVNSPFFSFNATTAASVVVSTNSTTPSLENDSSKLIYFTPSFSGFQLVVSYAPDGTQDRGAFGFGTGSTQGGGSGLSNAISIGADYSGEFSGVTVGVGGGYSRASAETSATADDDPTIWAAGINIGFAGFTVGGSIAVGDELGVNGFNGYVVSEATVFDVGATYNIDAVTVGVGWSHGEYDGAFGSTQDGDEADFVNLELGYALGDGVLLGAFIGYFDFESGGPATLDNSGWQAGVGAGLDF
ncbi:MAG: porin [Rhodospirillales bacterium]|nr:porin [Rhodospirillales bacterium]